MSDFIRIALLKKYGGVWLDSSVTLFQSIDDWCMNKIENKQEKKILCGFYMPFNIAKGTDYFFEKGDDYWENWFIATTKNNPVIEKWHFIFKSY